MNVYSCLNTSNVKLGLWIKFLGIFVLHTLIFLGPVKAQTFSTPGNFTFTVPNFSGSLDPGDIVIVDIELIIVGAGGGGGRGNGAGGGGGGQVIQTTITANEGDVLTGTIGSGGLGGTNSNQSGSSGNQTSFAGTTAQGGIGGDGGNSGAGGASGSSFSGGLGNIGTSREAGGGGGGAGGPGTNGIASNNPVGGNGGIGITVGTLGYGGGGGGTATRPGGGGTTTFGSATDGGTPGSAADAIDAQNGRGGGGGGGRTSGGRGGDGVIVIAVNFRVLPIEFLYFKTDYNSSLRSASLNWATAKEWENSHFEVQRSIYDAKSWETIGEVKGAGSSDRPVEYTYQDLKLPLAGGNVFYRLKQVDFSGKYKFSDTKAIQFKPVESTTSWKVYPIPTNGHLFNLEMMEPRGDLDEKVTVRMISPSGQHDLVEGVIASELSWQLSNLLQHRTAGIYTLEISWGKNREYHKVILKP